MEVVVQINCKEGAICKKKLKRRNIEMVSEMFNNEKLNFKRIGHQAKTIYPLVNLVHSNMCCRQYSSFQITAGVMIKVNRV